MAIADGERRELDPRSVVAQRITGGLSSAVLSGMALVGVLLIGLLGSLGPTVGLAFLLGWLALTAGLATFALGWPGLRYRHTSYAVSDQGICIRRGVVWRSIHFVPRNRIQHTDVSQGPIERIFELATMVLYTAGTEHASVSLSGLQHDTALQIRDHLIDAGSDDAV